MTKEKDELLVQRYPKIFRDRYADMRITAMCWGFECGDGWFDIINNLCKMIQDHLNSNPDITQVIATQVKEKYGELRFYYYGGDDLVEKWVDNAEEQSVITCEFCGVTPVKSTSVRNWIYTACEKCLKKIEDE